MVDDILEFFCRHLIGIGWYEGELNNDGEFTSRPTFYGASGFLLQLHDDLPGSWALITAGHVFTDYRKRMSTPKMGAKNHSLLDIWAHIHEAISVSRLIYLTILLSSGLTRHAASMLPSYFCPTLRSSCSPKLRSLSRKRIGFTNRT